MKLSLGGEAAQHQLCTGRCRPQYSSARLFLNAALTALLIARTQVLLGSFYPL